MSEKRVDLGRFYNYENNESKRVPSMTIKCAIPVKEIKDEDSVVEAVLKSPVFSCDLALQRALGFPKDCEGHSVSELVKDTGHFKSLLRSLVLNNFAKVSVEYAVKDKKGKPKTYKLTADCKTNQDKLSEVIISKETREESRKVSKVAQELFESVFYGNPAATVLIDLKGKVLDVNPQFTTLFGYTIEEIRGKDLNELVVPKGRVEEGRRLDLIAAEKGYMNFEGVRVRKDGIEVNVQISGSPLIFQGKMVGIIGTYFDITEIKKANEKVSFLATHDVLTNLPNRYLLPDRFHIVKAEAERFGHKVGVFFIDVNRFKDINDIYGHSAGDTILKEVAIRLSKTLRGSDSVIRWGGDEFVVVVDHIKRLEDVISIAVKLLSISSETFRINGKSIKVGLNIGISIFPDDSKELDELLRKADIAMYNAKSKGDNNFELYSKEIETVRLKVISDLKMREIQFQLAFEKSPLAACLLDSDGIVYRVNANFKNLLGIKISEALGRKIYELFSENVGSKFLIALSRAKKRHEETFEVEFTKDGIHKFYKVHIGTVPTLRAGESLYVVNFVDITQIRTYTSEIERREYILSTVIESSPLPMFVISKEHKVVYFNSAMEKLSGVKKHEVIGKSYMPVVHPYLTRPSLADMVVDKMPKDEILKQYPYNFQKNLSSSGVYFATDMELLFRKGKKVVDIYVSPILDDKGNVSGAVEILNDKSEQFLSEQIQLSSYRIISSALSSKSLNEFLESVHDEIGSIMPADNFFIGLKEGKNVRFIFFKDEHDKNPEMIPIGNSLTGYIFTVRKSLLLDKERLIELSKKKGFKIRGTVCEYYLEVPLVAEREMIGALVVQTYKKEQKLTRRDLKILSKLSDEIAIGILKKNSEEELQSTLEEEKKLIRHARIFEDVITSLEEYEDLNGLLSEILKKLKEIIPYETANVAFIDGNYLRNVISVGYEKYGIEDYERGLVQNIKELKEVQDVIKTNKPLLINDTDSYKTWIVFKETEWVKSHLAAPISVNGNVIGLLRIDSDKKNAFKNENVETIIPFATAVAIAIKKANHMDVLKNLLSEKSSLADKIDRLLKLYKSMVDGSIGLLDESRKPEESFDKTINDFTDTLGAAHGFLYKRIDDFEFEECCAFYSDKVKFPSSLHKSIDSKTFVEDLLRQFAASGFFVYKRDSLVKGNKAYEGFEKMGVGSAYIFPVTIKEEIFGFFGFSFAGEVRELSDEEFYTLKLLSILFSNSVALQKAKEEKKEYINRIESILMDTIFAMVNIIEARDPYTAGHGKRVSEIATLIAEEMGLDKDATNRIRISGLLHDIGKIVIPSEILNKPSRLNQLEFGIVKDHVNAGYSILKNIRQFQNIANIVLMHHERLDGSGYPNRIKGENILLEARIIAICDVYDAMTSHRPYRSAYTKKEAINELVINKGKLYDPQVVDAFVRIVEKGKIK